MTVRIALDEHSWQAGYFAGTNGIGSQICPPEVPNRLAYRSGYIEGSAARRALAVLRE